MKSIYNREKHSFQEQPQLNKPSGDQYRLMEDYKEDQREYESHVANLRTIPCRPGDVWEEGRLYEEGKDYEISSTEMWTDPDATKFYDWDRIIVPLKPQPPAQEAELWRKLFKKLNTVGVTDFSDADISLICNLYELKSYTLSLKSEQPEAIEFAEWLISEGHWNLGDYNDGSFTIDGLYKEYLKKK